MANTKQSDTVNKIKAMGGIHSSNLTSDVQVLIVGDRNTDKYKFSVKNRYDMIFISPTIIPDLHSKWLNNDDKNDSNFFNLNNYSLPVFYGFNICLARIVDDDLVNSIDKSKFIKIIEENGGKVSDSLTNSNSCLLTNEKSGKRYQVAKKWNIPIIHPEWLNLSVKRNAALEFSFFNIDSIQELSNIGRNCCTVWEKLNEYNNNKKRSFNQIDDISRTTNNNNSLLLKKKKDEWSSIMNKPSNNFMISSVPLEQNDQQKQNLHTNKTKNTEIESNLFKNHRFLIKFFNDSQFKTLKKVIESHSGEVLGDLNDLKNDDPNFIIIIPSFFDIINIPIDFKSKTILTEWFIERSLHYKSIKIDHWGKPFYTKLNLNIDLNLSITGFFGIELLHLSKLIDFLKLNLNKFLNTSTDLLIINVDTLNIPKDHQLFKKFPSLFNPNLNKNLNLTNLNSIRKKLKFSKLNFIPILSISYLFEIFSSNTLSNINNIQWCVYCPKYLNINEKIRNLIELENDSSNVQNDTNTNKTNEKSIKLPKLTSPVRKSANQNNNLGRLVGRASISQLDSPFISTNLELESNYSDRNSNNNSNDNDNGYDENNTNDNLIKSTQISYDNGNNNFLNLLNNENRKRTRAELKQMMSVLED